MLLMLTHLSFAHSSSMVCLLKIQTALAFEGPAHKVRRFRFGFRLRLPTMSRIGADMAQAKRSTIDSTCSHVHYEKAFKFRDMDDSARSYAQDSIVTLSGLYGCLRPYDRIREVHHIASPPPTSASTTRISFDSTSISFDSIF